MKLTNQTSELGQLDDVASWLLQNHQYPIIAFKGEMGSGKTTLIKAVLKRLGIVDEVSSPTFSLVNEYLGKGGNPVYHFDFYRVKNEMEALDMGLYEYLDSGDLCLIEWPEKIRNLLPAECTLVTIEAINGKRTYELIQPIDE